MYPVARDNLSFFSNHFEKEMEKAMLTARNVLEQLFYNNSDFSGGDEGKGSMLIVVRVSALQLSNRTRAWTRQTHVSASSTKHFIFTIF